MTKPTPSSTPQPILCHLLVGPPASGKTTFSQHLLNLLANPVVISTDEIRAELYGDEEIQGAWAQIEAIVLERTEQAIQAGHPVIYDATNVRRAWRLGLLEKLQALPAQWIAWVLTTPLKTCLAWNRQRSRQIPDKVIIAYSQDLKKNSVEVAEGFWGVCQIDPSQTPDLPTAIQHYLNSVQQSHRNRQNRLKDVRLHRYSRLLDFERLMHLIALLSRHPGLGNLWEQEPLELMSLLNIPDLPTFTDSIAEIAAVITAQHGWVYANPIALTEDLAWLQTNGFLGQEVSNQPLTKPEQNSNPDSSFVYHTYSDWAAFERLMGTLRYIIQNPLDQEPFRKANKEVEPEQPIKTTADSKSSKPLQQIKILAQQLQNSGVVSGKSLPMLRKDIENVFRPYQIFPEFSLRKGYFLGTGILNSTDLLAIYEVAKKHADSSADALGKATVAKLEDRLRWAQIEFKQPYSTRTVAKSNIINPNLLGQESLISEHQFHTLETDIRQGNPVQICRRKGAASFDGIPSAEEVWPLQIIFHSIAWYLGYQVMSGPRKGLFCFERLDRLFRNPASAKQLPLKQHQQAIEQLETLLKYSFGLYLGNDTNQQQEFLAASPSQRLKTMLTLDLRFKDSMFSFVSEGTQRFPLAQVQMSAPPNRDLHQLDPSLRKKLFGLKRDQAQHPSHPYQMKLKLPVWSFADVTLKAWLLGLGPAVKVLGPETFRNWILRELQEAQEIYDKANP